MAKPASRQELIDYSLRALGAPVLEINIDEDQLEDRLDEAIQFYQEYHSDAVVRRYFKHQITALDITNKYIPLPESMLFVNRIFPLRGIGSGSDIFSITHQLYMGTLGGGSGSGLDLLTYTLTKQYLSLVDMQVSGLSEQVTFSRHRNRLNIEFNWATDIQVGQYIVIEGYETIDPTTFPDVYNDMMLKRYTIALLKRQWGQNLIKFDNLVLPGGVTLNGRQIYDDAVNEITAIEEKMQLNYEMPPDFFVG